jgi:hypothetical protein
MGPISGFEGEGEEGRTWRTLVEDLNRRSNPMDRETNRETKVDYQAFADTMQVDDGDIIVLRVPNDYMRVNQGRLASKLMESTKKFFPNNRIMMVPEAVGIGVIKQGEVDHLERMGIDFFLTD